MDFFQNKLDISLDSTFESLKNFRVSPHLFVRRNGKIIQMVPFDKRAWHAGKSSYNGRSNFNDFSIGIELEGSVDDIYENEQYASLVMVTKALIEQYDLINKERIAAHSEIAPERKTDPGEYFDWKKYLKNV